jgi:hypothetical protein
VTFFILPHDRQPGAEPKSFEPVAYIVEAHGHDLLFRSRGREGFAPDLPGAYFDSMPKTVHHFNNIRQMQS